MLCSHWNRDTIKIVSVLLMDAVRVCVCVHPQVSVSNEEAAEDLQNGASWKSRCVGTG